jgi:hypothetical protein
MSRRSNRTNPPSSQLGGAPSANSIARPPEKGLRRRTAAVAQPQNDRPVPDQRQPHGPDKTSSTDLRPNPGDNATDTDDDNTRGGLDIDTSNTKNNDDNLNGEDESEDDGECEDSGEDMGDPELVGDAVLKLPPLVS